MGVSKFISTSTTGVPVNFRAAYSKVFECCIDVNQLIHHAQLGLNKLPPAPGSIRNRDTSDFRINMSASMIRSAFATHCKTVLDDVINELREFRNLERLYLTIDGSPCYGKIQQQILRRKNPKNYYDKEGNLIMSSAHILPGTPLMKTFTTIMMTEFEAFRKERKRSFVLSVSSDEIPGEGEHKALDIVRNSSCTSFAGSFESGKVGAGAGAGADVEKWFMIWSNDSDVIISLLHQDYMNIFVMTEQEIGEVRHRKCFDLADIRIKYASASKPIERHNITLLLALAGNDYLPSMMDTNNLQEAYARHRALCTFPLTKEDRSSTTEVVEDVRVVIKRNDEVTQADSVKQQDEVVIDQKELYGHPRVIDFNHLKQFFSLMLQEEIRLYHTEVEIYPTLSYSQYPKELLERALSNPTEFKRNYYKMVYRHLRRVYTNIPTYCMQSTLTFRTDDPSDQELFDLEHNMAMAWLKTYVWYYYYQSGYAMAEPLDNSFYLYGLPPLYSSLYIQLDRANTTEEIQYNFEKNRAITPFVRPVGYFESLPDLGKLLHYIVLREKELRLLYKDRLIFEDDQYTRVKTIPPSPVTDVKTRHKNVHYSVYPFANIHRLVETYKAEMIAERRDRPKTTVVTFGEEEAKAMNPEGGQDQGRGRGISRYRVKGRAVFPKFD